MDSDRFDRQMFVLLKAFMAFGALVIVVLLVQHIMCGCPPS